MTSSVLVAAPTPTPVPVPRLCRLRYEPGAADAPPDPAEPSGLHRLPPHPGRPPRPASTAAPPEHRSASTRAPSAAERADAHRAAASQLRLALEVYDGRRPAAHIARQVTPSVLRYWRVAVRRRRVRGPSRFTRMRTCLPASGVVEVAATCDIDGRPRALAARFEFTGGRWCCTAVRLG